MVVNNLIHAQANYASVSVENSLRHMRFFQECKIASEADQKQHACNVELCPSCRNLETVKVRKVPWRIEAN